MRHHTPRPHKQPTRAYREETVRGVGVHAAWIVEALLMEAIARDALGDPDAAGRALATRSSTGRAPWACLRPPPESPNRPAVPVYRRCTPGAAVPFLTSP